MAVRSRATPIVTPIVLLLFYAAALVRALPSTTVATCSTDRCRCPNNWNLYSTEVRAYNGNNNAIPANCPIPGPRCECEATPTNYVWGIYGLNFPIPTRYPRPSNAQTATSPWMYSSSVSRKQCCAACQGQNAASRTSLYCAYWLHIVVGTSTCSGGTTAQPPSGCGFCIIFPPGTTPPCTSLKCSISPFSTDGTLQLASNVSVVGKGCAGGKNDPHFVGAHGTHFDFNGVPDKSFCLITEKDFQVNMKMRGYYDHRTVGASVLSSGMAVRTWIKELGVMWLDASGVQHTFKMVARDGKSQTRDDGLVGSIQLDGNDLPRMVPGDSIDADGGFSLTQLPHQTSGGGFFEVDVYRLNIADFLSVEVRLRIAHPLLQTADDAMAHINVKFLHVAATQQTHGVLGQTFQAGREKRALEYTALAKLLGRDVAADSELGKGFLDGQPEDYQTSDTLKSDCKFSRFGESLASAE